LKPQSDHSFYANLSFFSGCESSFSLSMKGSENPPPYATTITTCFAQESPIGGWEFESQLVSEIGQVQSRLCGGGAGYAGSCEIITDIKYEGAFGHEEARFW